ILADQVGKGLRAVLAVERLVLRHTGSDGRAPPPRSKTPSSHHGPRLRPRLLRHPQVLSLPLLPSGPDGVRRPELRRSRPSTPFAAARLRIQTSAREFGPAKADCRCRVPPAPHLARPWPILPGLGSGRV